MRYSAVNVRRFGRSKTSGSGRKHRMTTEISPTRAVLVDEQRLRLTMAVGTVKHFGFESGGLVDLYRRLVPN